MPAVTRFGAPSGRMNRSQDRRLYSCRGSTNGQQSWRFDRNRESAITPADRRLDRNSAARAVLSALASVCARHARTLCPRHQARHGRSARQLPGTACFSQPSKKAHAKFTANNIRGNSGEKPSSSAEQSSALRRRKAHSHSPGYGHVVAGNDACELRSIGCSTIKTDGSTPCAIGTAPPTARAWPYGPWRWNGDFHPYGARLRRDQPSRVSPFHDLNGFQYHPNWLHNLLIASSMGGLRY